MERVYDTSRANGEEQFDCLLHCLAWWGKDSWEEREFLLCRLVPEKFWAVDASDVFLAQCYSALNNILLTFSLDMFGFSIVPPSNPSN